MPKPLFQDNGSGMHTHQSLWKNGKNLFYERGGYADISQDVPLLHRRHPQARARAARVHRAATNSYKRLVPGYEAPINLVYSQRNRSAAIRIPDVLARRRAPSASSSARRTRPATRICRSPRA